MCNKLICFTESRETAPSYQRSVQGFAAAGRNPQSRSVSNRNIDDNNAVDGVGGCSGPVQRIQSTACAHATVNPSWHQSLMFPCAPSRQDWPLTAIHVTVWDRDRFLPDRLIGYVTVKLAGGSTQRSIWTRSIHHHHHHPVHL